MKSVKIVCEYCGSEALKLSGHYNRSKKIGAKLFCSQKCFGKSRRKDLTIGEKKLAKRIYDMKYRAENRDRIKAQKAERFRKDYAANPEKYRAVRILRRDSHAEYCRRPEYMAKKHKYDRARYAKNTFGPAWEAHVLAMEIQEECQKRMSKFEIMQAKGTINKALQRSRNAKAKRSYT